MATLFMAGPTAAQQDWQARATHERQVIDSDLPGWSDWTSWGMELRRFWSGGNLALDLVSTRRFGLTDQAAALDGYLHVTSRTYMRGYLSVAPDAQVMPDRDHRLEVFHATPGGWEGSVGYRLMSLSPKDIHIFHAAVARYLPGWYLRTRASVNPSFEEKAFFAGAAVRRFLPAVDGHVELAAGTGEEVVEVAVGPTVDIRGSRFASIRTEAYPWGWVGAAGQLSYHSLTDLPARVGVGATIMVRW